MLHSIAFNEPVENGEPDMRNVIVLSFVLLASSPLGYAQTRRPPLPHELLTDLPAAISQVEEQGKVQVFLQERRVALQTVIEVTQASCPDVVAGQMSALEFAKLIDSEDAKADKAIGAAYQRLLARMSVTGRVELETDLNKYVGYAIDLSIVESYSRNPVEVERRLRWRCEVGFPEGGPRSESGVGIGLHRNVPESVPFNSGGPLNVDE
jgi:hypothetical protein